MRSVSNMRELSLYSKLAQMGDIVVGLRVGSEVGFGVGDNVGFVIGCGVGEDVGYLVKDTWSFDAHGLHADLQVSVTP